MIEAPVRGACLRTSFKTSRFTVCLIRPYTPRCVLALCATSYPRQIGVWKKEGNHSLGRAGTGAPRSEETAPTPRTTIAP